MSNTGFFGNASVLEVQTERVYQGTRALRVLLGAESRQAAVWAEALPPSAPDEVWVRGYFFFVEASNGGNYLELSSFDFERRIIAAIASTEEELYTRGYTPQRFQSFLAPIPRGRWVCLRLHVVYASEGQVELFLGEELIGEDSFDTTTGTTTGLTRVNVGFVDWRNQPRNVEREIYVDEVVVDTAPVPCDPMDEGG